MRSPISHLVSGFAGGALVLVGCVLTSTQHASEPQRTEPSVITASVIRLVDAEGRLRAYLSSGADNPADGPRLMFFDERVQTQIWLGAREGSYPALTLYQASGKYALELGVDENEWPHLFLCDSEGKGLASLEVNAPARSEAQGTLQLQDRHGKLRALWPSSN